jgi:hypothetical protein
MLCNILKHYHIMIGMGTDLHDALQPPNPVPVPMQPHICVPTPLCLGPWGAAPTGKPANTVISGAGGITMQKGTDIGMNIIHVCITMPANLLYPIIMVGSASKAYFGASSTMAGTPATPVAIAVTGQTNLNLNCSGPVPTPGGFVMTFNTVAVDFTFMDFLAGLAAMVFEALVQGALGKIFGSLATEMAGPLASIEDIFLAQVVAAVASLAVGSPMGQSIPAVCGAPGGDVNADNAAAAAQAVADYMNSPSVEDSGGGSNSGPVDGGVPSAGTGGGSGSESGGSPEGGVPDGGSGGQPSDAGAGGGGSEGSGSGGSGSGSGGSGSGSGGAGSGSGSGGGGSGSGSGGGGSGSGSGGGGSGSGSGGGGSGSGSGGGGSGSPPS